ncbi:MAG TPA: aminotransferase class I/II-fold pyridoxal phosphate-dependent enzyme [Myxococcota bacterium]|jgi:8-amino-7-oxononanoate synthase|nr:aminotransferase class I/II-fold pyridoxal phosphate-dependent enzyme [Myxococcota bacterium]
MSRPEADIAIVGMACQFAEAKSLEQFWRNVLAARQSFSDVPKSRWGHEAFFSRQARDIDKTYAFRGAFIDDVAEFAALHYGIAPRRVEVMDPQHRLLIDAVRGALQDAGMETRPYDRSGVGVFVGISSSEYRNILQSRVNAALMVQGAYGKPPATAEAAEAILEAVGNVVPVRAFSIPGTLLNMAAASVAQQWDFGGPAFSIDAACASALVATWDAMLYLRTGKCDVALAAGAYLNLTPENLLGFARIGAISQAGSCRPFDAAADGMLQGDGVGVVVLKRLEDARRDGDRVYAVIKGGGINNDGRSEGPMTPRLGGQVDAVSRAYQDVDFGPETVGFVECHGTATTVGDPVEVDALREVFGREGAARAAPCWLGSVKANVGHTMSAAGIAGLIRATLALERRTVPPQAGFVTPNPLLRLEGSPFAIPRAPLAWEAEQGYPRRAGVSSFGFGGTNCHLLLEEAPAPETRVTVAVPAGASAAASASGSASASALASASAAASARASAASDGGAAEIVVASAPSRALLAGHLRALADAVDGGGGSQASAASLADIAYTLSATRLHESARLAVAARDKVELVRAWRAAADRLAAGGDLPLKLMPGVWLSPKAGTRAPAKVAFLFPGQGAQRVGLLRHFWRRFPRFRARLEALAAATDGLLERPLLHYLYPELAATGEGGRAAPAPGTAEAQAAEARLTATEVCQPVMAALGIALADLLDDLGVQPAVTVGHSLGEFAAAAAAGLLSGEDAVRFVARRGLAMRDLVLADPGAMAAVMTDRATVEQHLGANAQVVVANLNHPRQTVVSGSTAGVTAAVESFEAAGIEATRLPVSHAFHSRLLEGVAGPVAQLVGELSVAAPRVPVVSAISRDVYPADAAEVRRIMARHATSPVDFVAALEKVVELGATVHVQVGAGTTLCAFAAQTIPVAKHQGIVSLSAMEDDGGLELMRALGLLCVLGHDVRFARLFGASADAPGVAPRPPVSLPATPLETQPYWAVKHAAQPKMKVAARVSQSETPPGATALVAGLPPASGPAAELVALFREQMALLRAHVEIVQRQNAALRGAGVDFAAMGLPELPALPEMPEMPAGPGGPSGRPASAFRSEAPANAPGAGRVNRAVAAMGAATATGAAAVAVAPTGAPGGAPGAEAVAVIDRVMEIVSVVSAFPRDALRPEQQLAGDLGFDSLMVVDLGAGIEAAFPDVGGLPQSLFVNKTTIADVAAYVGDTLRGGKKAAPAPAAAAAPLGPVERYRPVLEERPLGTLPPRALDTRGFVLVTYAAGVEPGACVADRVAARLVGLGHKVAVAALGAPFEGVRLDDRLAALSWPAVGGGADAEALFAALADAGVTPSGVVHLAALGEAHAFEDVLRGAPAPWPNPVPPAQQLARALHGRGSPALFVVATGMGGGLGLEGRADAGAAVWQAALAGFAKSLAREWPDAVVKAIDLDPAGTPEKLAAQLVDEMRASDGAVEVGWAAGARRVTALAAAPFGEKAAPRLGERSVVVITGGGRGLGAKVAADLARHYRPRLVLLGSQPAPAAGDDGELAKNLRAIAIAGGTVRYAQCDVCDGARVAAVFEEIRRTEGPVDAVIHAAGVIKDRLAADKQADELRAVMDVKVAGFLNVLRAVAGDPLQLLVTFSSWAGRFGNARQTDYAAANELMNRLAPVVERLRPETKVVSISWPPWEDSAMVRSIPELVRKAMRNEGVTFLGDDEGLGALRREIESTGGGEVLYGKDLPARQGTMRTVLSLALDTHPYLRDHRLGEHPVLPLAAALDYAAGLALEVGPAPGAPYVIRDFRLFQGVQVIDRTTLGLEMKYRAWGRAGHGDPTGSDRARPPEVQVELRQGVGPRSAGSLAYRGSGAVYAPGAVAAALRLARPEIPPASAASATRTPPLALDEFYRRHTFHGPLLQGVVRVEELGDAHVVGWVRTSTPRAWIPGATRDAWAADPLALDASFQLCGYWAWLKHQRSGFPLGFGQYVQLRPFGDGPVRCTIVLGAVEGDQFTGTIYYDDAEGRPLALMTDVQAQLREVTFAPRDEGAAASAAAAAAASSSPDATAAASASAAATGTNGGNGHKGNGHGAPVATKDIPEEHYRIEKFAEVEALGQRLQMAQLFGLKNPYFSVHEGVARDTSVVEGRRLVNYSSYNYLGMSGQPDVTAAVVEAVQRYGTSVSASRVASGEKPVHGALEAALADFLGCEASLVFVSGHATNVTVVGHLMGEGDLILHDQLAHDSILQGAFLSGAKRRPFPHSDWKALDRTLQSLRPHYNKVLLAIEGVYSMDGDVPELPRFIELRERHKCLLLVDEAHSLGVLGKTGRGVGEHFNVDRAGVDVWMGTLSKSLASCGGYVAGSHALVEYLKYTAPGFVYSAGISPANAAAALAALGQIVAHPEEVEKLHRNCRLFLDLAKRRGINTGMTDGSAVIPCIVGNSIKCLKLSQRLAERGINVQPIIYPAVEDDAARLRFFLSSTHTEQQLRDTIEILAEELGKLDADDPAESGSVSR